MTRSPVHQWIDRWESHGLLTPPVARALRDDVEAAPDELPTSPTDDRSAVERALAVARGGILEALGYLGAAVTLGAFGVLLDLPSWPDVALVALTVVVALVAGGGVFAVTPAGSAAGRRLGGVLGFTSVAATTTALVQLLDSDCVGEACSGWQEVGVPVVIAAVATAVAFVLYRRHVHLLTHAALGASTAGLAVSVGLLVAGPGAEYTTSDAWSGGFLLAACLGWVWASEADRLHPAWLGTLAAGGVSYSAAFMMTSPWVDWLFGTGEHDHAVLVVLALATAYTVAGAATSRLRPTIVGAAGLAVSVPWTLTEVLGLTPTTTAGVLLPVGIVLTGWAIVAGRREGTPRSHG